MNYLLTTILLSGVSLLCFGIAKIVRTVRLLRAAIKTEATIIEFAEQRENRRLVYVPVVVFFTSERKRVEFKGERGTRRPKQQIGESIAVLYHRSEPEWCRINAVNELWLPGSESIAGGLLLAFGAAHFLRLW